MKMVYETYAFTLSLLHDRYAVEPSNVVPLAESSFQLKDEKKQSSQPRIDASADLTQENENLRAEIAKIRAENERLLTEDQQRRAAMTELREEIDAEADNNASTSRSFDVAQGIKKTYFYFTIR